MRRRIASFIVLLLLAGATLVPAASAAPGLLPGVEAGQVPTLAPLLREITPAVVNIAVRATIRVDNPLLNDPFFRRFFNIPPEALQRQVQSAGSGVIVDAGRGYVLTNHHVVERADEIVVTTKDGRRLSAQRIGSDAATDIAVLKIDPGGLTAMRLGDSDALEVGDYVLAIGNPFGLGQTVTSGIVSALGRTGLGAEGYEDFIQTDASINPGNSGGALANLRGELIGINTAILAPNGSSVGIGFAVPINMARAVMEQILRHGEVRRGRLGVEIQDVTPDIAQAMGLQQVEGAAIVRVEGGSPAARAGLRSGDVVTAVDGRRVRSAADLRNRIGLTRLGETVELTVLRRGAQLTLQVRVDQVDRQPAARRR